jgi:hypothetical protein
MATEKLTVAVLGAGNVGGTLGRKWIAARYQVVFAVSDPNGKHAQNVRGDLGNSVVIGSVADALARMRQALRPEMMGETLINFRDAGNVGPYLTRTAYTPRNHQRLRELKNRYDPTDVFRFNHTIPPS